MMDIVPQFVFCLLVLMSVSAGTAQVAVANKPLRTLDVVVADVLRKANVPGGIEVVTGCNRFDAKPFEVTAGNVDDALAGLSRADHTLKWSKRENTYTVTIGLVPIPTVTSANLPALRLKVKTLSAATDLLLQQRATQNRITELKLSGARDEIGFSSIHERDERVISLPAGTLRDDLNAIAAAFGSAIWQLNQQECGGSGTFRLSWIAK